MLRELSIMKLEMILRAMIIAGMLAAVSTAQAAKEGGLAGMHDLGKEGGKLCMTEHSHSGSGTGATKNAAKAVAIRSWIDFTNLEYGRAWASFANSASQKTTYTKEQSGWSATVEGRPCKR